MEFLYRMLCIVLVLHGGLLVTPTSAAYPQVLDIQFVAHNQTDLSAVPTIRKEFTNCDASCEALKSLELESNVVKLSSLTVYTESFLNFDWPLMGLYKIIFTMMSLKYLRQPVLMWLCDMKIYNNKNILNEFRTVILDLSWLSFACM